MELPPFYGKPIDTPAGHKWAGEMENGTVRMCGRVACYNRQNGRECWDAQHSDGTRSYEWESEHEAHHAATHYTHRDVRIGLHRDKLC